jgi:hypothetical protein
MGSFTLNSTFRIKLITSFGSLVVVYGAAHEDSKAALIPEMVNLAKDNPHPILIGGASTCFGFLLRRVKASDFITIGSFYSMLSLIAWILERFP